MDCIVAGGLSKSYGDSVAVDGIDLRVDAGQAFGFLGSNGAGKSTTIKMLTTLIRPNGGTLQILGIDALRQPLQVRRRIGLVQQQHCYEPTLSVEKALTKYGMMWDIPRGECRRRALQLIEDFHLGDFRKKRNEDLSIGQRRRVQVAREFMHDMDLLFLDEPTVGMDPSTRHYLLDYLKERVAAGLTIFYTTHILSEADYLCDNIAIIQRGRIIASGTPADLKKRMHRKKTITIRTNAPAGPLLADVPDCTTKDGIGDLVTIESVRPEQILLEVIAKLQAGGIKIREISAVQATLEDIFLETVNASDNTTD